MRWRSVFFLLLVAAEYARAAEVADISEESAVGSARQLSEVLAQDQKEIDSSIQSIDGFTTTMATTFTAKSTPSAITVATTATPTVTSTDTSTTQTETTTTSTAISTATATAADSDQNYSDDSSKKESSSSKPERKVEHKDTFTSIKATIMHLGDNISRGFKDAFSDEAVVAVATSNQST